jgi:hypothetical protein
LLNNICEEAREQNKELWVLFQDTAKAFDTVNLQMLHKALIRIKIPPKTASLLLTLFQERKFRVIINDGFTDSIIAGDGIDQGETISPLLWRIFYDPLLCKIQDNKNLGYTMQCTWQSNMASQESSKLELRSAAIAYMDDTTWVSYSKQNLQMILEDAREFYLANDSQINSSKSILLNINSTIEKDLNNNVQAGLNRDIIQRMSSKESTRFLGIWLGSKDPKKDTVLRIQQEIDKITSILKNKKATDKQALYIFNRVLIPRIEFRTQICHIAQQECDRLTRQFRKVLKNKAGICSTIPNSTIHHKGIYNLKSIWNVQLESQITGLIQGSMIQD